MPVAVCRSDEAEEEEPKEVKGFKQKAAESQFGVYAQPETSAGISSY